LSSSGNCTIDCWMRDGQNISGVVRNTSGDYTISFTTSMSSANYCVQFATSCTASNNLTTTACVLDSTYMTASSVRVITGSSAAVASTSDISVLCALVFAN
jgi:hypothetical protein